MDREKLHTEPRHPIGVVSSRTGIPQDLIRAWERRYGAVTPQRSGTGRRLYSDEDIARLKLLRACVAGGRRISDVAGLSAEELGRLIAEDGEASVRPRPRSSKRSGGNGSSPDKLLSEGLDALEHLDRHRLEAALSEAAVSLSSPRVRQEILVPMLETIGERWREGSLRIAHEHLASAIVRSFLSGMRNGRHSNAPRIVVTTPAGQRHELGALMAAAAADESGWNVFYLGPDLPAEEIAAAVRQLGARAVGLSIVYNDGEEHVVDELRRIRSFVPDDVMLFVGGRASCTLERHLGDVDIHVIREIPTFQNRLISIGT